MDFHGITMKGQLKIQKLPNLPTWTENNAGDIVLNTSTNIGYLGTNSGWERITIPQSLLNGNGSGDGGETSMLSNVISNYLNSGFISLGKTNHPEYEVLSNGICIKREPTEDEVNKFYMYATTKDIAECNMDYVPTVYLLGTIMPLVGERLEDGSWNLPVYTTSAPLNGTRQDLIYIEFFKRIIDGNNPIYYPWGNMSLEPIDNEFDNRVKHTVGFTTTGISYQMCWKIRTAEGEMNDPWLDDYKDDILTTRNAYGMSGSPVEGRQFIRMKDINGEEVLYRAGFGSSDVYDGLNTADGYVFALPICFIHRRSRETFNLVTPNGTAAIAGSGNGGIAKGLEYNGRPDGLFYDIIVKGDIWDVRFLSVFNLDREATINRNISAFMTGNLYGKWVSDEYGTQSSAVKNNIYRYGEILTADGIGRDAISVFGNGSQMGVFLKGDKGTSMYPDGVRRYWGDVEHDQLVLATCTQGDDNSEFPPKYLTYEPSARTITLNTTGLSGSSVIKDEEPSMYWYNNANGVYSKVLLSSNWTGLGTTSAACVINASDHSAHSGQQIVICSYITYPEGCGLRHNPSELIEISDSLNNKYTPITENPGFTRVGLIRAGSTDRIFIDDAASSEDDYYNGQWIYITNSSTGALGNFRLITDYDGATKQITVSTPFIAAPSSGDSYSISPLEPEVTYVIYNTQLRSITDFVKRQKIAIKSNGTAKADCILTHVSSGTIEGGAIIKDAPAGTNVDTIGTYTPAEGANLRIYYKYVPYRQFYTSFPDDKIVKLLHAGRVLVSTDGTLSLPSPDTNHVPFSEITPLMDGVKYIGTNLPPSTTIMNFDQIPQMGEWPYASMTLDSEGRTNLNLTLKPAIEIEEGTGFVVIFWIVEDNNKVEIVFSTRRKLNGVFDINKTNMFMMHPITRLVYKDR